MVIENNNLNYLTSVFRKFTFSENQISRILGKYRIYSKDISKIETTLPLYFNFASKEGYSFTDIIEMAIYRPYLMFKTEIKSKELKEVYNIIHSTEFNNNELINYENGCKNIAFLKKYGFSEKKINDWTYKITDFIFQDLDTTLNNISYFVDRLHFTKEDIIRCFSKAPVLFTSYEEIDAKMNVFYDIGFSDYEVGLIIKNMPKTTRPLLNSLEDRILWFKSKGFESKVIKKILIKNSNVFRIREEYLNNIYNFYLEYGFDIEDIPYIIFKAPTLLSFTPESVYEKLELIESYGFDRFEVIDIVISNPGIVTNSIENIKEKMDYLQNIDMLGAFKKHPKNIIQSRELTELRYNFLKTKYEDNSDIANYLFIGEANFEKRFKTNKEELRLTLEKKN